METQKKEEEKEMIVIFDPSVNAYREVPVSVAEEWLKSAKEVEKKLAEIKKK